MWRYFIHTHSKAIWFNHIHVRWFQVIWCLDSEINQVQLDTNSALTYKMAAELVPEVMLLTLLWHPLRFRLVQFWCASPSFVFVIDSEIFIQKILQLHSEIIIYSDCTSEKLIATLQMDIWSINNILILKNPQSVFKIIHRWSPQMYTYAVDNHKVYNLNFYILIENDFAEICSSNTEALGAIRDNLRIENILYYFHYFKSSVHLFK